MAVLFSKVTLTADNGNTAQLLCGGIPTSNYDLEDWLIYQKFICDNMSCREIKAIAVVGGKNGDFGSECAPCGICRQFLAEFCEEPEELKVLLTSSDGNDEIKRYSLSELLPKGFGKKNLN